MKTLISLIWVMLLVLLCLSVFSLPTAVTLAVLGCEMGEPMRTTLIDAAFKVMGFGIVTFMWLFFIGIGIKAWENVKDKVK